MPIKKAPIPLPVSAQPDIMKVTYHRTFNRVVTTGLSTADTNLVGDNVTEPECRLLRTQIRRAVFKHMPSVRIRNLKSFVFLFGFTIFSVWSTLPPLT